MNVKATNKLGSKLFFNTNVGTRLYVNQLDSTDTASIQWLSLGMSSKSVFSKDDKLQLTVKYIEGDTDKVDSDLMGQSLGWKQYSNIFSEHNTGMQLAYSRQLGQNLRWQFLLEKANFSDADYSAKMAWRFAF